MTMCVNCGRNPTDKTICDTCRRSFPGHPAALDSMIGAFQTVMGAGSYVKTCRCGQNNRVPLSATSARCGKCKGAL